MFERFRRVTAFGRSSIRQAIAMISVLTKDRAGHRPSRAQECIPSGRRACCMQSIWPPARKFGASIRTPGSVSTKGFFGAAASPLVEGNAVYVNVGGSNGAGLVAFDKTNGDVALDSNERRCWLLLADRGQHWRKPRDLMFHSRRSGRGRSGIRQGPIPIPVAIPQQRFGKLCRADRHRRHRLPLG